MIDNTHVIHVFLTLYIYVLLYYISVLLYYVYAFMFCYLIHLCFLMLFINLNFLCQKIYIPHIHVE